MIGRVFLRQCEQEMLKRVFIFSLIIFSLIFLISSSGFAEHHAKNDSVSFFDGKRIAVATGTINDEIVHEALPSAKILYFETDADTLGAVITGKADAYADDEEVLKEIIKTNDELTLVDGYLKNFDNALIFSKTPQADKLRGEFDEYFTRIKSDGTLDEINSIWFSDDESLKTLLDYENLPDINGIIKIAISNESPPFDYVKDRRIAGYEADIIVRFCKEKGYKPVFVPGFFSSVIPAVVSGKCAVGMGVITVTEERALSVNFSVPTYTGGTKLLVLKSSSGGVTAGTTAPANNNDPKYKSLAELNGKPIGIQTGNEGWNQMSKRFIPDSKIVFFNNFADLAAALLSHKIEGFFAELPVYELMAAENGRLAMIDEKIDDFFDIAFGFPKTEEGKKLCDEVSEYIRSIKASGELEEIISKWFGLDESKKIIPDYKKFPASRGVLSMVTEGEYPPFNYIRSKNEFAGFEIDIAVRFCERYGYGLKITAMTFDSILASLITNKYDFAGAAFPTASEHKDSLYFSEPYYKSRSVLVCLKSSEQPVTTKKYLPDFNGEKIGVQIGTTCAELVPKNFTSSEVSYFNSLTDALTALKTGKINAMCCALPSAVYAVNEDTNLEILEPYLKETYLYSIFVNSDRGKRLCGEYSDFLKTLWDNGTIDELANKWLGADESKKTVDDYSKLPAINGTVKMAVDTSIVPFAYVKDNKIVGHAVDLAVRFCKAKGYALEISDMSLSAVIASVKTGKCDFTQAMTKSKERGENTLFAESPSMKSGNVLLVMKNNNNAASQEFSALAGKRIGVVTGSTHPQIVAKYVPTAEIVYFDNAVDELTALKSEKIDAACTGIPLLRRIMAEDDSITSYGEQLTFTEGAPIFQKNEKGEKLCAQFSEFAKACWDNGTIKELESFWFDQEENKCIMKDYSKLPAPNGVLKTAVNEVSQPFVYFKDNRIVGYDIEFIYRFCEAYGYGLEIMPMRFAGIIPAVTSGKCDLGIGAITITDERKESVLFSYPNVRTGNVFSVKKVINVQNDDTKTEPSFFDELKASFERTFIREDRYKLFIEGIINTMTITVLSIFWGIILGFTVFMLCRTGNIFANIMTKFSVWLIKGTPIVVLLMIFYYIIFGSVDINGIWVAVIAFTLTFATSVYRMLTFGTGALDKGQTEAAYALGYTDLQTFFTIILPQAALHFMPSFREEVTVLIKSTAVVGYIAVQDLTKMGDIVRSRTYEAFFPLIAVAVIYFILAGLLNVIVLRIHWKITPSKRKPEDILKGINLKGDNNYD